MKRVIPVVTALVVAGLLSFLAVRFQGGGKPLLLGYAGSLSGKFAVLSASGRDGALLAVEHMNSRGGIAGKQVHLVQVDDAFNAQLAVQALEGLHRQGVSAIIGPYTSAMAEAMIGPAQDLGVLLVSPTASSDSFSNRDDLFLRVVPATSESTYSLGRFSVLSAHVGSLCIVADQSNIPYTSSAVSNTRRGFLDAGGQKCIIVEYDSRQNISYSELAARVLETRPGGVLMVSSPLDTAAICQRIRLENASIPLFATSWGMTGELIQNGGRAVEGIMSVEGFDPSDQSRSFSQFVDSYHERFGRPPDFSSMYSYESVMLLAGALAQNPEAKGEALKRIVLGRNPHEGLQGNYTLNRFGDVERGLHLLTVSGGKLVSKD